MEHYLKRKGGKEKVGVTAEIRDGRIYIDSQYADRETCKILPGSRWDKELRQWSVPLTWASCKQLRSTFGTRLEIGPVLLEWARNEVETRVNPCMSLRDAIGLDEDDPINIRMKELGLA